MNAFNSRVEFRVHTSICSSHNGIWLKYNGTAIVFLYFVGGNAKHLRKENLSRGGNRIGAEKQLIEIN